MAEIDGFSLDYIFLDDYNIKYYNLGENLVNLV
jgi:hypothetical protein